ncbi:MAG: hypothetical protein ABIO82_06530, partial [Ginsengibacter sp.]
MKKRILFFLCTLTVLFSAAQVNEYSDRDWRITVERSDGMRIVFQMQSKTIDDKIIFYIINASEKIQ